jgi:hypothetical protein
VVDEWLDELEDAGCVARYEVDGARFVHLCRWALHQKVSKPTPSTIPRRPAVMSEPRGTQGNPGDARVSLEGPVPRPVPSRGSFTQGVGPIPVVDNPQRDPADTASSLVAVAALKAERAAL